MDNETVSILDKKADDITVRDALKINAVILAVMVGVPLAIAGIAAGYEVLSQKRQERKAAKTKENLNAVK